MMFDGGSLLAQRNSHAWKLTGNGCLLTSESTSTRRGNIRSGLGWLVKTSEYDRAESK